MKLLRLLRKVITPKDIALLIATQVLSRKLKANQFSKLILLKEAYQLFKKFKAVKKGESLSKNKI